MLLCTTGKAQCMRDLDSSRVPFLETMLETNATLEWRAAGCGFLEGYLTMNAIECFGGSVVTWNEVVELWTV